MSHKTNSEWLETKYEVFNYALKTRDIELAKNVINDLYDAGFDDQAEELEDELPHKEFSYVSIRRDREILMNLSPEKYA